MVKNSIAKSNDAKRVQSANQKILMGVNKELISMSGSELSREKGVKCTGKPPEPRHGFFWWEVALVPKVGGEDIVGLGYPLVIEHSY